MYPSSTWTSSEEIHRLIVAPLSDLLARVSAMQEPQLVPVPVPARNAPRNMLDPKQSG
jgi:hypothetical protein